ncbi:hypothetical protein LGQ03_07270 [Loktanella sp. TSTF-M6]|uniref:Uncharacterized protein n=1 Tax=Loktanella gaetbuli TaxID=2881335 RepID=A0ABS8BU47_9RHOB|nr:hypothetical protein [Loktanella gaetbuli]MCB5199036.1 hypothetical protein [Loktanella gaetbuli]
MPDRIASQTPFIPSVAFGLKALTVALKAKGCAAARCDIEALQDARDHLVPDDLAAAQAVSDFAAACADDQRRAGAQLHDFIATWRRGEMRQTAARTEQVLQETRAARFDWQDRKDCGHG